jgi:iron complex transport system ATP-binding protein
MPPNGSGPGRDASTVLALSGVTVVRAGRTILGPVDWTIRSGERWAVLGPNGSGKSTLLQIASTYLWPSRGAVGVLGATIGDVDARELRRSVGYVAAALAAQLDPELAAVDVVMTARHGALAPWWHTFTDNDRGRALALLDLMGCGGLAERTFGTLSSGERQRLLIARTLMTQPSLLLLDEPAAGLDLGAREALVERLTALAGAPQPAGIALVTHHVEEIPPGFTHAMVLGRGIAIATGPIHEAIRADVLSEAFGLPLDVDSRDGRFRAWASRGPSARP